MFGCFRTVLASRVVIPHLWPVQSQRWGIYAVFCFYLVSGYLMTLVLDRSQPCTGDGRARHAPSGRLAARVPTREGATG